MSTIPPQPGDSLTDPRRTDHDRVSLALSFVTWTTVPAVVG